MERMWRNRCSYYIIETRAILLSCSQVYMNLNQSQGYIGFERIFFFVFVCTRKSWMIMTLIIWRNQYVYLCEIVRNIAISTNAQKYTYNSTNYWASHIIHVQNEQWKKFNNVIYPLSKAPIERSKKIELVLFALMLETPPIKIQSKVTFTSKHVISAAVFAQSTYTPRKQIENVQLYSDQYYEE